MCSDDPHTVVINTERVNQISNLVLNNGVGNVVVETGKKSYMAVGSTLICESRRNLFTIVRGHIYRLALHCTIPLL